MANKIIHKHSNVVNNNKPKLPTKDQFEYGEIAINYAKGNETISLKNSSDEIIEFKSKNYVDEQINSNNERIQAVEDSIDLVNETIEDNELVTATAITKLEGRTTNVENGLTNKSDIGHTHVSSAITDSISASGSITSTASSLVQGKAVYNYAAPKSHASSSTTYGAATTSNYGHVKISNGDVATVASANGLAAGMDHTHSNYSTTGHTHDIVSSSENGFAPKVSDGGTIDNSNNDLVLTSDNGTIGWRKLPANAFKDTDTKVTAPSNHYIPTGDTNYKLTVNASGATSAWNIDVVKGVSVERDAKGHITNLSVTSGKIPNNPNTDTKVIQTPTTNNGEYPVLLAQSGQTGTTTGTTYFDSGITINPSSNTINAKATSAITADKVSNNLTITLNNGSTEDTDKFTFDGSSGKTVNITASNIGAATINDINIKIAEITANAPESFDTLKEIADWISNDTTGAAKMANDIDELKNSKSPTGHTHVSSAITDSISASGSITSTASGLVQGKAVYNYAAPKSHASSATTYGAATTSNYGHVKISNGDVATVASADGLAAGMDHTHSNYSTTGHTHSAYSPTGHTHVSSAITDSISASGNITSTASGLVQGKAVYNYAAPKSHTHSNYSPTGHTHVSSAITDTINSMSGITGTETKLVQAKAVYELINDTEEQIAETLLEHDSRLTTLSNNFDSIVTDIEENELVTATAITELENLVNGIGEELDNKSDIGHTHVSSVITDSIISGRDITSTASGLVQGKAVYNYAAPKSHASSSTTYGAATTSNYGHVKISNGDVATVASANGLAAGMDHTHSNYSTTGHTHKGLYYTYDAGVIDKTIGETESAPSHIYIESTEITNQDGKLNGMLLDLSFRLSKTHVSNSSTPSYVIEKIIVNNSTEISLYYYLNNQSMLGYRYDVGAHRLLISIQNIDNYFYGYIFNVKSKFSDALASSKLIDGVYFNGSNNITHYAVCESAGSSAEKVIVLDGFEYTTGASIWVKFENTNTATSPYLSINGDTQKRYIRYGIGTAGANTQLNAGVWNLIWDGTVWRIHIPEMVNQSNKIKVQRWASGTSNAMPLLFTNSGYANTSSPEPNNANNNTLSGVLASTSGYSETYIAAIANKPLLYQPSKGVLYAGNATVHVSDERLKNFKEDIQVDFNELKKIPKKYFTWKNDDNNELNIGTSAQELEKVYPELVSEYPEEGRAYKTVNYSNLSIIALAAIDKLNERIEYLENKLKEYENK